MTSAAIPPRTILARDVAKTEDFSRGVSIGLAFDAQAGIVSAIASLFILVLLFVSLMYYW
jgi:hypothetical protein